MEELLFCIIHPACRSYCCRAWLMSPGWVTDSFDHHHALPTPRPFTCSKTCCAGLSCLITSQEHARKACCAADAGTRLRVLPKLSVALAFIPLFSAVQMQRRQHRHAGIYFGQHAKICTPVHTVFVSLLSAFPLHRILKKHMVTSLGI